MPPKKLTVDLGISFEVDKIQALYNIPLRYKTVHRLISGAGRLRNNQSFIKRNPVKFGNGPAAVTP